MQDNEPKAQSFLIFTVAVELGLGVVALLLGWLLGPDPRHYVPQWHDFASLAWDTGVGLLAAIPLTIVVYGIEKLPWRAVRELQQATEERLIQMMSDFSYGELAAVSLCAGVGEEMLFRGWLMMHLAGPMGDWNIYMLVAAIIASSVAFGLAHPLSPLYIAITGLIGVYMALLFIWTESLVVPVVAHAFYDFIQLVLATRQFRSSKRDGKDTT